MYFAASTGGFYSLEIHGQSGFPDDAVELTAEEYRGLMEGQRTGLQIQADASGHPVLVQAPAQVVDPRALIAARRYQAETAGITVNGMPLDTGRDSQALVTGAALAGVIDPTYACQWKTAGGFVDMSAEQIIALASAMRAHVQACFDREAALLAALEAGTYTAEQLDQGWPA
ncbi:TPA: DUF4376 domain-containing protein [Pseudomonas aeruginosa]|nr:DUF4376 domain-containing protein [Pseudomonas aeruginosa]HCK4574109.1 DUF4376 domain-containing protein [Pseudomonas aeruginosa]HCK4790552.1 DUF4376 domain-containing protein [Pseudomonas aeruginosa]HCK4799636.1 DUF4376 domain-containing protein [Pseudomonas aeruginosa]HCK5645968.1 DUF4376 domain-containing protein [Pseudomonas aeruginosa]